MQNLIEAFLLSLKIHLITSKPKKIPPKGYALQGSSLMLKRSRRTKFQRFEEKQKPRTQEINSYIVSDDSGIFPSYFIFREQKLRRKNTCTEVSFIRLYTMTSNSCEWLKNFSLYTLFTVNEKFLFPFSRLISSMLQRIEILFISKIIICCTKCTDLFT